MPYTPPQNRSPSSSAASSPSTSRRSSINNGVKITSPITSNRPSLPRSSSYLARHRRSTSDGSVTSTSATGQTTPRETAEGLKRMVPVYQIDSQTGSSYNSRSVCQSPPPVTGERKGMPSGAVISPPDSPRSSSDDEGTTEIRGRQIENIHELKQLHEAISQLPKPRRESSPSDTSDIEEHVRRGAVPYSYSTGSLDQLARRSALINAYSRSSSSNGRRVSHVRSATEPNVTLPSTGASSLTTSDDENDLEILRKPQMVRKKSGELVRPALRLGSGRRPSSMPGTPTFSKAVHFDSHLEHVRHFLQVDRPLAVSVGSSPVDAYDSESEYPFNTAPGSTQMDPRFRLPHEWEITLSNFPVETPARKELPVRLERVWLSADQKCLNGSVAVENLAFSKWVVCRFTLDYWKTTSEVAAEYSAEIVPRSVPNGHDRFNFTIKLSDMAHLESKTLFFCIRYNVGGKEFWDNNGGRNFQVDFKKTMLPINGKAGFQAANGLPRSSRRQNVSMAPRPVSMPANLDDFDNEASVTFNRSIQEYLGEPFPELRLKTSQSLISVPSDNLGSRVTCPSGLAFANRYDFGASLSAAMQSSKDSVQSHGALYMKPNRKVKMQSPSEAATTQAAKPQRVATPMPVKAVARTPAANPAGSPVAAPRQSGVQESISSKSYDEIVSKYCFYVPNQPNTVRDGASQVGQGDRYGGQLVMQNQSTPPSSSEGSPVLMGSGLKRHATTALRHSMPGSFGGLAIWQPQTQTPAAAYSMQPRSVSSASSSPSSSGSGSPASPPSPGLLGVYSPLAASPSSEHSFQHMQDRFPFNHAQAIKG